MNPPRFYLYRNTDILPPVTDSDRATPEAWADYRRLCAEALAVAERAGDAVITDPARWRAQLTLATMFGAQPFPALVLSAQSERGELSRVDNQDAHDLSAAWSRAVEKWPLVLHYPPNAPVPSAPELGDAQVQADFQAVLHAVVLASDPALRDNLRNLTRFASEGSFFLDCREADHRARAR